MAELSAAQSELLHTARRAVLATTAGDGSPRLVPITFVRSDSASPLLLYSALDEKPKTVADPRDLARARDIAQRPRVSVLVDRWSENWNELGWLRLRGTARLIEAEANDAAEHGRAIALLRAKYEQYASQALERRPVLRIEIDAATGWTATP